MPICLLFSTQKDKTMDMHVDIIFICFLFCYFGSSNRKICLSASSLLKQFWLIHVIAKYKPYVASYFCFISLVHGYIDMAGILR